MGAEDGDNLDLYAEVVGLGANFGEDPPPTGSTGVKTAAGCFLVGVEGESSEPLTASFVLISGGVIG